MDIVSLFVLVTGPTFFLLDLLRTSVITFSGSLPETRSVFAVQGWNEQEWLKTRTRWVPCRSPGVRSPPGP